GGVTDGTATPGGGTEPVVAGPVAGGAGGVGGVGKVVGAGAVAGASCRPVVPAGRWNERPESGSTKTNCFTVCLTGTITVTLVDEKLGHSGPVNLFDGV